MEAPSMEEIEKDHHALRIVSPAYAGRSGEMTATLQYVFQSIVLGSCGRREDAEKLMRIAVQEMHHMEILGTLICKLGAPPIFTSCPPYPVGYYSASSVNYTRDFMSMIRLDILGEKAAIEQYRYMIERLNNGKVISVLEGIVRDEEEHLAILEELQKKTGVENACD